MKTTRSAIHKLTVSAECGCTACGEYKDEACKQPAAAVTFTPCTPHKDVPGLDLAEKLMKEAVVKEAKETVIAPPPVAVPTEPPAHLDGAVAARRANRTAAAPAEVPAAVAPATPAIRIDPNAKPGTETRIPIAKPARADGHVPGSGQARVVGGSPGGIKRADTSVRGGLKVAGKVPGGGGGGSLDIDMDGVAEDRRVTSLVEQSGFLDEEDDLGGEDDIEF